MRYFYISDTHFGHENIIRFDKRPFRDTEEMEKELIRRWNSVVENGDTVYILGDFCWKTEDEWIRILKKLNGQKVLISGNHDRNPTGKLRKLLQDVKDYKEIKDNGRHVILSHYPILFYKSAYNKDNYMLCGHIHTTRENDFLNEWRAQLRDTRRYPGDNYGNIINVGCMMPYMDYTPRTLDELIAAVL